MPYYKVGAIITRDPITGVITRIAPQISRGTAGDTNAKVDQDVSMDAFSFFVIATADPIQGMTPLTRAQRDTESDAIADAQGRNRTAARADMDRRERDLQQVRDRTTITPRTR